MTIAAEKLEQLQAVALEALRQMPRDAKLYVKKITVAEFEDGDFNPNDCDDCESAETVAELLDQYVGANGMGDENGAPVVAVSEYEIHGVDGREDSVVLFALADNEQ